MKEPTCEEMLESTDVWALEWFEPRPGMREDGEPEQTPVTLRTAPAGALLLARRALKERLERTMSPAEAQREWESLKDTDMLMDFMAVNWCRIIKIE